MYNVYSACAKWAFNVANSGHECLKQTGLVVFPMHSSISSGSVFNIIIYIYHYIIIYILYILYNYFYRMAIPLPKEGMNSTDFEHPFMWKCQGGCITVLKGEKETSLQTDAGWSSHSFFPVLKVNIGSRGVQLQPPQPFWQGHLDVLLQHCVTLRPHRGWS